MAKALDLQGQRFGRLTVQYRANKIGEKPVWHCLCDCGNECDVSTTNLRNGNTKSCGCLKTPNLLGRIFGEWIVIDKAPGSGYGARWLCRCSCGTERIVSRKSLIAGTSKSCGCTKVIYKEDYTGQKFGNWTVIEKAKENSNSYWNCQCSCGKIQQMHISSLVKQGCESCSECQSKKRVDLSGQRFGKLVAQDINWEITKIKNEDTTYWNCKCDCGNMITVSVKSLRDQVKTHCGCSRVYSKGEEKIKNILNKLNLSYNEQYSFNDLIGHSKPLRFDFFLPKEQIAIEYQGEQHYKVIKAWENDNYNDFQTRQLYDQKKRIYCQEHNILLIEIPYTDFNKINEDYILKRIKGGEK